MIIAAILMFYISTTAALSYIGQVSVNELLYGDLTNLQSFFMLRDNNTKYNDSDIDLPEKVEPRRPIGELLAKLEQANQLMPAEGHDVDDFNSISKGLMNLTRKRWYGAATYAYDLDDYYNREGEVTEKRKKMMLVMANLQFLIHTRYKIRDAFRMRNVVKRDKRYRLGYLFNRLRRLLNEQRKFVSAAHAQRTNKYTHNLYGLMRMYEKVVRLDVDMRDTAALIKSTYAERASIDLLY